MSTGENPIEGVDFSSSRPDPAALVAAGKQFVVRYVPYGGYNKGLTADEVAEYRAAGLALCLVWESLANRPLGGVVTGPDQEYAAALKVPLAPISPQLAGKADAAKSMAEAARLGFPAELPIYFACDFDTRATDYQAIDAYLRGAASVIGAARVGVYAEYDVVEHCLVVGSARYAWQTYAWSAGRVSARAHLLQYRNGAQLGGGVVDLCRALKPDYGQWSAPLSEEDAMPVRQITKLTAKPGKVTADSVPTTAVVFLDAQGSARCAGETFDTPGLGTLAVPFPTPADTEGFLVVKGGRLGVLLNRNVAAFAPSPTDAAAIQAAVNAAVQPLQQRIAAATAALTK